jgi:hypothetical protein
VDQTSDHNINEPVNDGNDYQDRQDAWLARAVNADRRYTIYGPKCFKDAKKAGHQQDDLPSSEPISTSDKIEALLVSEISSPGEAIAALEEVIRRLQNKKKTDAKKAHSEKPAPGSYLGWNSQPDPDVILPQSAPEKYIKKIKGLNYKQDAITFLDEVWGKYIRSGVLFQDDLRRMDRDLVHAVYARCNYKGIPARSVLPPSRVARLEHLSAEERLERQRERDRLRKANSRPERQDNLSAEELLAKRRERDRLRKLNNRARLRSDNQSENGLMKGPSV